MRCSQQSSKWNRTNAFNPPCSWPKLISTTTMTSQCAFTTHCVRRPFRTIPLCSRLAPPPCRKRQSDEHDESISQKREPVSTLDGRWRGIHSRWSWIQACIWTVRCFTLISLQTAYSANKQKLHCKIFQTRSTLWDCLWEIWRAHYRGKTTLPGHQHNARMSLIFPIIAFKDGCACVEIFLQHPRSALRSEWGAVIQFGQSTERRAKSLIFMDFSMITGALMPTSSPY